MMYKNKVMTIANDGVNNNPILRSDAVKNAHVAAKFQQELEKSKLVIFRFLKKDGSIRIAKGTMHKDVISDKIKGTSTAKKRNDIIVYYDLEKDCFRSFKFMNFIDIVLIKLAL